MTKERLIFADACLQYFKNIDVGKTKYRRENLFFFDFRKSFDKSKIIKKVLLLRNRIKKKFRKSN